MEKSPETCWPFKREPYGNYTFAPYDHFGARYVVPDEATYQRLKPGVWWSVWFVVTVFVPCLLSLFLERSMPRAASSIYAGVLLAILVGYVAYASRTAKALVKIEERPPFRKAFGAWANEANALVVWLFQLFFLGLAAVLTLIPLTKPMTPLESFVRYLFVGIFVASSLVCSAALAIRRKRVAIRR